MSDLNVAIISTGLGNIGSVYNMIKKVGGKPTLVTDPKELDRFQRIILPGVGTFDNGIARLKEYGFDVEIKRQAKKGKQILGICLGMQMLMEGSEEGSLKGLGLIAGECKRFVASDYDIKVPHMGWNKILPEQHPLFEGLEESRFYFVHSYYAQVPKENSLVSCLYGQKFTCGIISDNVIGLQFHPEKSHKFGMKLFSNFLGV